jgi:hypothetical protein
VFNSAQTHLASQRRIKAKGEGPLHNDPPRGSVMDRIEFYHRQASRFSKLARECADAGTSAKLLEIATEYREMLNGKAPADADDRLFEG